MIVILTLVIGDELMVDLQLFDIGLLVILSGFTD